MINIDQLIAGGGEYINCNRCREEIEQVNEGSSDDRVLEVDEEGVGQFIAIILEENISRVKVAVIQNFEIFNGTDIIVNNFRRSSSGKSVEDDEKKENSQ